MAKLAPVSVNTTPLPPEATVVGYTCGRCGSPDIELPSVNGALGCCKDCNYRLYWED